MNDVLPLNFRQGTLPSPAVFVHLLRERTFAWLSPSPFRPVPRLRLEHLRMPTPGRFYLSAHLHTPSLLFGLSSRTCEIVRFPAVQETRQSHVPFRAR